MHRTLAALLVLLLCACACAREEPLFKDTTYELGSLIEITIYGVSEAQARAAMAAAKEDFHFFHVAWHAWQPGSLERMNALFPLGGKFTASASVLPILKISADLSEKSGGLFNPAIGRLLQLWGWQQDDPNLGPPPAAGDIARLVATHPRMSDLHINGYEIESTNPAVRLDFGGIGQGYAADLVMDHFREMGIKNALINVSGDVRVIGRRGVKPWRIGIRDPRGPGVLASIELGDDESLVTSGDYERYYMFEGKRYHHILDPRTGYPTQDTASVSVLHRDATTADAAATALMVAGPKEWHAVAHAMGVKHVMLIANDGTVYMDPGTAQRIQFEVDPPPKVVLSSPL